MFAPGGGSSSTQVPAASMMASSSRMAFSQWFQSEQHLASVSMRGSNTLASVVSARRTCSSPSKFSRSSGVLLITTHTPPASSLSLLIGSGFCRLIVTLGESLCVRATPSSDCKSWIARDGLQLHVDQCSWVGCGSGCTCFVLGSGLRLRSGSPSPSSLSSLTGVRGGILDGLG